MPVAPIYRDVLRQHRERLARVVDKAAVPKMRNLYDQAQAELAVKLRRANAGQMKDSFTAHKHRITMAQVRQGQVQMVNIMHGGLGELSEAAQHIAIRGVSKDIQRLHKKFTGAETRVPIDEAARFTGVVDKRRTSLLTLHRDSLSNYGVRVVRSVENQLALSLVQQETTQQAIDRVVEATDVEWWQGERIVRTEMAWAYNGAQADAIQDSSKELPDLHMRWNELVDDDTGKPLDERVSVDSLAMHGQVVIPGENFIMPATSPMPDAKGRFDVPDQLVGKKWKFPPNRPNDRSCLTPWRPGWEAPSWRYVAGNRRPVK